MQRMAGAYIANRIKQELFDSPQANDDEVTEVDEVAEADELDGQIVHDDAGQAIGRAYRLAEVGVYVVTDDGRPEAALLRALRDPDCQLIFQTAGNRATAIIYVPEPVAEAPRGTVRGMRADDV